MLIIMTKNICYLWLLSWSRFKFQSHPPATFDDQKSGVKIKVRSEIYRDYVNVVYLLALIPAAGSIKTLGK